MCQVAGVSRASYYRHWETVAPDEAEMAARAGGELGWSAEWRKRDLRAWDIDGRTRRWREYCCESFCDTAAWLYGGMELHDEFTLEAQWCHSRRTWFTDALGNRTLSI